jgi:hypothetical protein
MSEIEKVPNVGSLVEEYFENIQEDFEKVEKELEKIEEERIVYEDFISKNTNPEVNKILTEYNDSLDEEDLSLGDNHIPEEIPILEEKQIIKEEESTIQCDPFQKDPFQESVVQDSDKNIICEEKINDILIQKIQNLNVSPKDIPKVVLPSNDSKKENKESKCIIC